MTPKLAVSVRLMSGWEVENRISIGRSRGTDLEEVIFLSFLLMIIIIIIILKCFICEIIILLFSIEKTR